MDVVEWIENLFVGLSLFFLCFLIPTTAVSASITHLYVLEKNGVLEGYLGVNIENNRKSVINFESRCMFPDRVLTLDIFDTFSERKNICLNIKRPQELTKMKCGSFSWEVSLSEIGNEVRIVTNSNGASDELFIYPVLPTYDTVSLLFSLCRRQNKSFDFYYLEERHQKKMFAKYEGNGKWSIRFSGREIFAVQIDEQKGLPVTVDFHRSVIRLLHPYRLSYACSRTGGLVISRKIYPQNVFNDVLLSFREKVPWLKFSSSDARTIEFKKNKQGSYGLHAEKITVTSEVNDIIRRKLLAKLGVKEKNHGYGLKVQKSGDTFYLGGTLPLVYSCRTIMSACPGLDGAVADNLQVNVLGHFLRVKYTMMETKMNTRSILINDNLRWNKSFIEFANRPVSFRFQAEQPESVKKSDDGRILLTDKEGGDFKFVIEAVERRLDNGKGKVLKRVLFDRKFLNGYLKMEEEVVKTKFSRIWLDKKNLDYGRLLLIGEFKTEIPNCRRCDIDMNNAFKKRYGTNATDFSGECQVSRGNREQLVTVKFKPSKNIYLNKEELGHMLSHALCQVAGTDVVINRIHIDDAFHLQADITVTVDNQGLPASCRFPTDSTFKLLGDGTLQVKYVNLQTCQ